MEVLSKHLDGSSPPLEQVPAGPTEEWRYDVFINFRGEDIRLNLVSFLFEALVDAKIDAFKDDNGIRMGREISRELVRAIRRSRIAVVLLSRRYAESKWCLMELAEIVDAARRSGQLVLPVFYYVDVQHVRCQMGDFAIAFKKHERNFDKQKVCSWREALTETANIMGFKANGNNDAVLVKNIVHWIEMKLKNANGAKTSKTRSLQLSKALLCEAQGPGYELWRNDVFLCYRGPDTRGNFTNYLYHALRDAGVHTFMAGETLSPGQDISLCLLRAIRISRFSVVVFSKGFANSIVCLEELAEIMEWKKTMGQLVIPVFYDIDPSCVRNQTGYFKGAFQEYELKFKSKKGKVARWRSAMTQAGSLSGCNVGSSGSSQAIVVKNIVRKISIALNDHKYLHVATFPVGLVSRLHDINKLILAGSGGVLFVGIVGSGGIGKTALAKAIYNQLNHLFESKSLLADVSATSREHGDVIPLQEQLLDDILKLKRTISQVDEGTSVLGEKLRGKEALVILDGVSDLDQIRKLAQREWFGSGSRIIITTRSHSLLKEIGVDSIYEVEALNNEESLQLFSSQAFRETHPEEELLELSKQVMSYCNGLPLTLTVLGASLHKRSVEEWKSAFEKLKTKSIEKLKTIPDSCIHEQLKISFDALDKIQKELFVDIAFFFVGNDKDYVSRISDSGRLSVKEEINYLINRCLVEVDENNKLKMHDLLRDMAREVVRSESLAEAGKRSRLWSDDDVLSILRNSQLEVSNSSNDANILTFQGTEEVEGIALDSGSDQIKLPAEAFSSLKNLKFLKLKNVQVDGDYRHISRKLRWLSWAGFSDQFIPDDFCMENLEAIDIKYSNLKAFGKGIKRLEKLQVLDISYSSSLTRIPDFSIFPKIRRIVLEGCVCLLELHQSIGCLTELVFLNLKNCKNLIEIPDSIVNVKSLETLNLSGCVKINKLPQDFGKLESLTEFIADGTAIFQLPLSIGRLKNLLDFSLSSVSAAGQVPKNDNVLIPSLSGLNTLKSLMLVNCHVFPANIGFLTSLVHLDLRQNNFRSLPDSIRSLMNLKTLQVDGCRSLVSLPDMPSSLYSLSTVNCISLERVSFSEFGSGTRLFLTNCPKLTMVSGLDCQAHDAIIHLEQCSNLKAEFREFLLKDWTGNVFLPESNIPDWFNCQTIGSSLSFEIPPIQGSGLKEFTICVTYAPAVNNEGMKPSPRVRIEPLGISLSAVSCANIALTSDDHMWVLHLPDDAVDEYVEYAGKVTLSADFGVGWDVKGLGIHYKKEMMARPKWNRPVGSVDADSGSRIRYANEKAWRKYTESATRQMNASEASDQEILGCLTRSSTASEKPKTSTTGGVLHKYESFHQGIQHDSCHSSSYCGATCGSFLSHSSDDSSGTSQKNGEECIITYNQNLALVSLQEEWSRYLGRVVRSRHICPLAVHSWEDIGIGTIDHMWAVVKEKIENIDIESFRDCTLAYMKELWIKWRSKMYNKYVKETPVAIALNNKPVDVHANDWKWLIEKHWSKETFQCSQKAARSDPAIFEKIQQRGRVVTYRGSLKYEHLKKGMSSLGRAELESHLTESQREIVLLKRRIEDLNLENIVLKYCMNDIGTAFQKVSTVMRQNFFPPQDSRSSLPSYDTGQGSGVQSPTRKRRCPQPQSMMAQQRERGEDF